MNSGGAVVAAGRSSSGGGVDDSSWRVRWEWSGGDGDGRVGGTARVQAELEVGFGSLALPAWKLVLMADERERER